MPGDKTEPMELWLKLSVTVDMPRKRPREDSVEEAVGEGSVMGDRGVEGMIPPANWGSTLASLGSKIRARDQHAAMVAKLDGEILEIMKQTTQHFRIDN
jgi:hypothetical protein